MRRRATSFLRVRTCLSMGPLIMAVVELLAQDGQAHAKEMTANELLGYCKKAQTEGSFCATYIAGFLDGVSYGQLNRGTQDHNKMGLLCLPAPITDAHMLRAVTQQLMREPENRLRLPAQWVLSQELEDVFPCPPASRVRSPEPPPPVRPDENATDVCGALVGRVCN
jgi:hypothetical protein